MDHLLLQGLSDDDRRAVLACMRRRTYRRHETVFHEGDPGDTLHLIERGHVAIRIVTSLGDTATLAVLGPGQSFGEQALLHPASIRTASVFALERVETRVLTATDFEALRAEHPSIDGLLIEILAANVQRLSKRLVEALFEPADDRIVRRLAELGRIYSPGGDPVPVEMPIRQEDLASMAGTTRPTVNRVLRQLAEDGVVELRRGRIDVLLAEELQRLVR